MIDRDKLLIEEFIEKGKLKKYENTLELIVKKAKASGCEICLEYNDTRSKIEPYAEDNEKNLIRVSFRKDKPIHILWDMLHEFGHHLSGKKKEGDEHWDREVKAWYFAEKELENYPDLQQEKNDFIEYKRICLETYK